MDIRSTALVRVPPPTSSWRSGTRERRERRQRRADDVLNSARQDRDDPAPLGPAMGFVAHVLGQGEAPSANPSGAALYAATRSVRLKCGVCADERA